MDKITDIDLLIIEKIKKEELERKELNNRLYLEIPVYDSEIDKKKKENVVKEPSRVIIIDI